MVLGKLPVPGRPTIWITVGQGPIALAVGAGGGCLDIFTLIYLFSPFSPSLWETARYRLKYCLKKAVKPKTTNQPTNFYRYGPDKLLTAIIKKESISVYTSDRVTVLAFCDSHHSPIPVYQVLLNYLLYFRYMLGTKK